MAANLTDLDSSFGSSSTSFDTASSSAGITDSFTSHCQYCISQSNHAGLHHVAKPYECDVCFGKFRQQSTYDRHMRMHQKEKRFPCRLCSYICDSESSMRYHVSEVHVPKEWYCSNKNKLFKEEKRAVVPSINKLKCQFCERTFNKKMHLCNHMRVHVPKLKTLRHSTSLGKESRIPRRNDTEEKSLHLHLGEPQLPNLKLVTLIDGYFVPAICSQLNLSPKVVLSPYLNDLFSQVAHLSDK